MNTHGNPLYTEDTSVIIGVGTWKDATGIVADPPAWSDAAGEWIYNVEVNGTIVDIPYYESDLSPSEAG